MPSSEKPHWDANSPELNANIGRVIERIRVDALKRVRPSLALIKSWHKDTMVGLAVDDPAYVGRFRGEPGVEDYDVEIGGAPGTPCDEVAAVAGAFEAILRARTAALDKEYPKFSQPLDVVGLKAVIDLAAWAHAEWVRIHPFANGNGRTARYLANFIFVGYGVGFVVQIRPRPHDGYPTACAAAMKGQWRPTAAVFTQMIADAMAATRPAAAPRKAKPP